MAQLNLEKISKTSYENLVTNSKVSATTIYWVDDKTIYVGGGRYGGKVEIITETPTSPEMNTIYVDKSTFVMRIWNGTSFETISKGYTVEITDAATDDLTPTAKAVVDYVADKVGALPTSVGVVDITSDSEGSIKVTKGEKDTEGNNIVENVPIKGVVYSPKWNSNTYTLTLPFVGTNEATHETEQKELKIEFGKDKVVRAGKYNADTKEIWLSIAEDKSYTDNEQVIKIPADDLIDIYKGATTSTASVTVSDNNEISVNVKVSKKEDNALAIMPKVEGKENEEGLYVDVSGKLDKVDKNKADEIIIANADGSVKVSGKKIGGESIATVPNANTVATEQAIKTYADGIVTWVNFE